MHEYYKQMNPNVKGCAYVYVSPEETVCNDTDDDDHNIKYARVNTLTFQQVRDIVACPWTLNLSIEFVYLKVMYIIKTHDSKSRGQEETAIICKTKNTRP